MRLTIIENNVTSVKKLNKPKHHKTYICILWQRERRTSRREGAFARAEVDPGSGKGNDKMAKNVLELIFVHCRHCFAFPGERLQAGLLTSFLSYSSLFPLPSQVC